MNFWHNFSPEPIIFQLGLLSIRWYGLLLSVALLLGLWLTIYLARCRRIKSDDVFDLGFWLALSGLVGARLYDVFLVEWAYFSRQPGEIFQLWRGGLAIHGAIVFGALALWLWAKRKKISFWLLSDLLVPALALGQAIGRWGNYFNQELFGRPTTKLWGIFIAPPHRPAGYENFSYFQPTFFYESILDFLLFLILFWAVKKNRWSTGQTTWLYLFGYGLIRFLMEFVRLDPTPTFGGLRLPQWVSLGLIVVAIGGWSWGRRKTANRV